MLRAIIASARRPRVEGAWSHGKLTPRWRRLLATAGLQESVDLIRLRTEPAADNAPTSCGPKGVGDGQVPARILVVDDSVAVLEDFRKILSASAGAPDDLEAMEATLFAAGGRSRGKPTRFEVDLMLDGKAACANAAKAREESRPYAAAFVDMRMPGGWDGLKTIEELWRADPDVEVVICTAYSDYAWHEITARLGHSDQLLILRKPFEIIEVQQLAAALSKKWQLNREQRLRMITLEQQVEERTVNLREALSQLEVANGQLTTALEAAAQSSQAKSQFLAAMSHELRTPLNAVIGFSEMLATEMLGPLGNPTYQDYAQTIANSGNHLLGLINDVLDFSKLDAGHLELTVEPIDLVTATAEAVRMMSPLADKGGVQLSVDLEDNLPFLRADERRLRQVLLNLLSNAVKFTPKDGSIRLSAFRRQGHIAIQVTDTGIGIAAEDIPKAFERFGQIDSGLSRRYDGTGLGLPLSKRLVELHGGTLTIDSSLGVGTTVTVTFPGERALEGRDVA